MKLPIIKTTVHGRREPAEISIKEAGQILVIFTLMLTALIGLVGIAIDVTFAWRSGLQVQRAADAAAMAGVVYLPGNLGTGQNKAYTVATENGYTSGGGTTVVADKYPTDDRKMQVTITASVPTFFVRLFGINTWTVTKQSLAAYVMPVPMGSPLSYMGVGCFVLQSGTAPTCNSTGTGQSGITTLGTTADGGSSLSSLGAFGAVITQGGDQGNGDAYLPTNNKGFSPTNNVLYNPAGYYYTAIFTAAGGKIQIFDPGFCAMGGNGHNGTYGTGDHWITGTGSSNSGTGTGHEVSTYYMLWDTHNTPLVPSAWEHLTAYDSGTDFENEKGYDSANGSNPGGATNNCNSNGNDTWHNKWYTLASGLPAGTYEIQVTTTDPADSTVNAHTNAENMFAIQVTGGGTATVFGYDKMCVYNNLTASGVLQQFYLAKVDATTGAGKTLTIDLFDVGDSTAGTIQILSPDGGTQKLVNNFSYTTYSINASGQRVSPGNCGLSGTSDACSASGRSSITVAGGSGSSFNNTWIEITIPLSTTYGSGGLWSGGWWQVQYNVNQGNDTTTWSVNVNGNPVHLLPYGG
jgi:hypothetical protein